jgi:hypothetical protein
LNPEVYEQQQQKAARATYEALLAAGAPEKLACAAALNPQLFQAVAPSRKIQLRCYTVHRQFLGSAHRRQQRQAAGAAA